jgi:phage minor structural protein
MLKLINESGAMVALLSQLKDFSIESDLATADKLIHFNLPKSAISRSLLQQEFYLQSATDEFVIKEINTSDEDFYEVFGKLNLDSLRGKAYLTLEIESGTLEATLASVLAGTGWTYQLVDANSKLRTIKLTNVSVYQIVLECCTVYGCEVWFDTLNKTARFYTRRGMDRGAYVYSELNLKDRDYQSDSYELATRLYPIGKDGLSIASVNGGQEYIDNHQYTSKVIERKWVDERYTNAQALYDDAIAVLDVLSKPRVSFRMDVLNLVGSRPEYAILDFQLGDTVRIFDKANQYTDTQRIVRLVEYPLTPEKNKADFSNSPIKYSGNSSKQIADLGQILSSTKAELNLAIDQVTALVMNGESGNVVMRYDELNQPYEILIMDTADINTATRVWRWNLSGLSFSGNGYAGPYTTAITMDGQIVANFISTGTLSADRIATHSLTADKLATGTITAESGVIADLAVANAKIVSIDAAKIATGYLAAERIEAGCVTTNKLAAGSITTDKLAAGAVTADKIIAGAIGVDSAIIAAGAITSAKIGDAQITTAKIAAGAITNALIETGAIGTAQIADGSITDAKIVGLTASKITAGTIDAANINVINLNASNLTVGTINGQQIGDGAVSTEKIAASAITTEKVALGAISATLIAADAITGDKIVASAITGDKIAASTITANNLVAGTITAASGILADAAITTAKISDLAVTDAKINSLAVTEAKIGSLAVTNGKIGNLAVTEGKIASLAVTNAKIADLAVTDAKIDNATITSAKIASIDAGKITTGSLDAARIAAESITVDKLDVRAKSLVNNYSNSGVLTGWTDTDGSVVSVSLGLAHRIVTTTNRVIYSDYFEVDPNQTYKVTLSIYCADADGIRYFGISAIDRSGAAVSVTPFTVSSRAFGTATTNFYFWSKSGSTGSWLNIEAYILGCDVIDQTEVPVGKVATSYCRMPSTCHRIRLRYLNYGTAGVSRTSYHFSPVVTPVNSGLIRAENVVAGTLKSVDSRSQINLNDGTFSFGSGALAWNGSALTAKGTFEAISGTQSAKLDAGSIRLLNSSVELGYLSIQTVGPTGPWLTAAAGATTINLAKVVGTSLYTAYKIDWGSTGSTSATHNFWGTTSFNGHPLSCGALTSGAISASGVVSCWRVEPHLDNNDRCGTTTKRWQAVHALEGYFNKLTIGTNTCWAAGTMSLTTASWTTVSFGKTFPSAPRVFGQYTHDFTGDIGMLKIRNITTTSFQATIGGSGFSGIAANWFAILV